MRTIDQLVAAIKSEATRHPFPVDLPIYEKAGKDPTSPILYAGDLEARVCFFARDLGKDEVRLGQPLVGAGGRLVRAGIIEIFSKSNAQSPPAPHLESALKYAVLTNTVPFKPPGNKAYAEAVKDRFRPFLLEFLTQHWQGNQVLTLGTEAFQWFLPYDATGAFQGTGVTDERFRSSFPCRLPSPAGNAKDVEIRPLPHPSPLNRRWYSRFPGMLIERLQEAIGTKE